MRKFALMWLAVLVVGVLAGTVRADTFRLSDGQSVIGDPVSFDERGVVFRLSDGKYSDRVPWGKFSQEDLKKLAQNPKAAPFAEPFIEQTPEERIKRTEVELRDVPRLERPPKGSVFGALFSSSVGLLTLLLLYAANLYAAYEISIFRAQPAALVCGVAAVLPVIGPIIFLSLPTRIEKAAEEEVPAAAEAHFAVGSAAPTEAEAAGAAAPAGLSLAQRQAAAAPAHPPSQTFARGQFTFNRRFFETRFPAFFGIVRRDAEKDMVLLVKSVRGAYVAERISRIAANDMHLQVRKGQATEEVTVPFVEIQEVVLKHKDA